MEQQLLQHLVSRLQADIDFLASQSLISQEDASLIRSKLPNSSNIANQLGQLTLSNATPHQQQMVQRAVPPLPVASPALGTGSGGGVAQQRRCRATWDYNATQPDDLQFRKGDVITLIAEENADWWRGSIDGRTGIFPSNYVERIDSPGPSSSPGHVSAYPSASTTTLYPNPTSASLYSNNSHSPSFGGSSNSFAPPPPSQQPQYPYQQPQPYAAQHQPPFHGAPQNQWDEKAGYQGPQQQQQFDQSQVQLQQQQMQQQQPAGAPPIPPKKNQHKFAKQMGTAFAGGVGFGTGASIASNAINAIF